MEPDSRSEYRIVRGDLPRRIRGIEARKRVQQALHGIVVTAPTPQQHADWWYDLRRGQLRVYGALLRFIDLLVMSGASRKVVMQVPQWITWYAMDALDARDGISHDEPKRAA
jgi:hypothetical protein